MVEDVLYHMPASKACMDSSYGKTEYCLPRGPGYPLCLVARAKSRAVTYTLLSTQTRFDQHIHAVPRYSHVFDLLHSWEEMRALNLQAILKILPTDFINK